MVQVVRGGEIVCCWPCQSLFIVVFCQNDDGAKFRKGMIIVFARRGNTSTWNICDLTPRPRSGCCCSDFLRLRLGFCSFQLPSPEIQFVYPTPSPNPPFLLVVLY